MKKIIIANWKMNLLPDEERELALAFKKKLVQTTSEIVICPSFLGLGGVAQSLDNSSIAVGAQDVFWARPGAYTGEISLAGLEALGCRYVIIGHSERRALGESDEDINRKVLATVASQIIPIICVGETEEERREGLTGQIILRQVSQALSGLPLVPSEQLVIAYEPVWAIGSGREPTLEEIDEVLGLIRQILFDNFPASIARNNFRLLYGGSVDAAFAGQLATLPSCSGLLVGGSSLDPAEFAAIVKAF